jgi:hypothetical protein
MLPHHCTADAQSWRSRLAMDVGEGQQQIKNTARWRRQQLKLMMRS